MKQNTSSGINLLSRAKLVKFWPPNIKHNQNCWKVFSGHWLLEPLNQIISLEKPEIKAGENIVILRYRNWDDFILQAKFKILTDSIKPPEGGVIFYFRFKNVKNYYSFHCCISKKKIQFIKRNRGIWKTLAENGYNFEKRIDYWITLCSIGDIHTCKVDGRQLIEVCDSSILKGNIGLGAKYSAAKFNYVSISEP